MSMTTPTPGQPLSEADVSLLPCPFCGTDVFICEAISPEGIRRGDSPSYDIDCDGCGLWRRFGSEADAIAAWNRRPHAPVSRPGDGVEGESVAIMRPFWVSWWGEPGTFELHRPWWVSGERDDGKKSICAAVLAQDEFTARLSVQWAHDDNDAVIEWRFAEEKPKGWSPFGSRFPQADWMIWPEMAALTPPAEPVSRPAGEGEREAVARAIQKAIGEAWIGQHQAEVAADAIIALLRPAAPDAGGGSLGPLGKEPDSALKIATDLHAAYEQLIYGLPKYLDAENLTDEENMIREAYITLDVTAHRLAALQPGGER